MLTTFLQIGLKAALGFFGDVAKGGEFANQGATFALSMIETSIGKTDIKVKSCVQSNLIFLDQRITGITVGLFVATLIIYPKGSSHTPLMNF